MTFPMMIYCSTNSNTFLHKICLLHPNNKPTITCMGI